MEISGHKTDAMIRRYNIKGNQDAQRFGNDLTSSGKRKQPRNPNLESRNAGKRRLSGDSPVPYAKAFHQPYHN